MGLDVIQDKLKVSFAKAPSRAGFPRRGPSRVWAGLTWAAEQATAHTLCRAGRSCGPCERFTFHFSKELEIVF